MKVMGIKDIDKFFEVVDSCKGKVELVTGEGDRLNLKSKLSQYVSLAIIYWIITIIVEQGIKLLEKKIRIPENAPAIQTDEGALNQ